MELQAYRHTALRRRGARRNAAIDAVSVKIRCSVLFERFVREDVEVQGTVAEAIVEGIVDDGDCRWRSYEGAAMKDAEKDRSAEAVVVKAVAVHKALVEEVEHVFVEDPHAGRSGRRRHSKQCRCKGYGCR